MRRYLDLIEQTFYFPTPEFHVENGTLFFYNYPLMDLINKYGTPLRMNYLPKISENIKNSKSLFQKAMDKYQYNGNYYYCYCTKSSHFSFVLNEVLKNDVYLETSSSFDMAIIQNLYNKGKWSKDDLIICNGCKKELYKKYIVDFLNQGFSQCIPVLDNTNELDYYENYVNGQYQLGIRVAAEEEPNFTLYTSRLGLRYSDVLDFYREKIKNKTKGKLKLLHFFINTGIKDTTYYWSELGRFMQKYCELKKICPELDTVDIGGGFPVKNSLHFEYDYQYMTDQIIENIQEICSEYNVPTPHILTEFGNYTVAESGAIIYSVMEQKQQNDMELWYMIDGSIINDLPDIWGMNQKYITLAINNWENNYQRVNIGGLTCDSMDYYNSEAHNYELFMPDFRNESSGYVGFFHTGAYQEALSGFGGIQHCLIPAPQHVILDKDKEGNFFDWKFASEQKSEDMLKILGF